ncbi:MAG TPA: RecX family transcriptional regulator [Ignavibacteriales bacterium]|nr:RecX family transcriptional regulator [Ignavibacteriales bacterium]
MKIIKIEKAGLNAKVYFEEEETVSFRCELLLKSGLRKGDVVDESLIEKLSRDNEKFLAKESAFNFLSRRMHSVKELETKLKKKKYSGEAIREALTELAANNYLDDEKFAGEFIKEKIRSKKIGEQKLKAELLKRGIKADIIERALSDNADKSDIEKNALLMAEKKMKSLAYKNLEKRKLKEKIFAFLLSKGYNFDAAKSIADKLIQSED